MSEKEKQLALDIIGIFDRLPEVKKQRLVGVAEGLDMPLRHRHTTQQAKRRKTKEWQCMSPIDLRLSEIPNRVRIELLAAIYEDMKKAAANKKLITSKEEDNNGYQRDN